MKFPTPSIEDLLGKSSSEIWLKSEATALATGGQLQRAAAVGLLLRLWTPSERDERKQLLDALLYTRSVSAVEERCKAFVKEIDSETTSALEENAVDAANALADRIDDMQEAVARRDKNVGDIGLSILLARDDMECVCRVLECVKLGAALRAALIHLDEAAAAAAMTLRESRIPFTERLQTVATAEPDAWWAYGLYISRLV